MCRTRERLPHSECRLLTRVNIGRANMALLQSVTLLRSGTINIGLLRSEGHSAFSLILEGVTLKGIDHLLLTFARASRA